MDPVEQFVDWLKRAADQKLMPQGMDFYDSSGKFTDGSENVFLTVDGGKTELMVSVKVNRVREDE